MKNWKELGEVPDSDDEDFDDFESQEIQLHDPPIHDVPPAPPTEESPAATHNVDIWDVPESSPPEFPITRPGAQANPLSKAAEQPRWLSTTSKEDSPRRLSSNGLEKPKKPSFVIELPTSAHHSIPQDYVSTSYVRIATPPPPPSSPLSSPLSVQAISPEPPEPSPPASFPPSPSVRRLLTKPAGADRPTEIVDDDAEIARQTGVRLERSLRPRKPIQQHPYLLENAQYTTFMKSHGVRPIKVTLPTEATRKAGEEEDSQEQDYVEEESQDVSGRRTEDTPLLFDNDLLNPDDLAPSPSPPRTSPINNHLRTSSQPPGADTTPLSAFSDDDDLPTLDDILRNAPNPRRSRLKRQSSQSMSSRRKRRAVLPSSSQASSPPRPALRTHGIWDITPSPLDSPVWHQEPSQLLGNTSPSSARPKATPPGPASPVIPRAGAANAPILIDEEDVDVATQSDSESSGSSSQSDVIRQTSKRIRGVLPASWLRLDQKNTKTVGRNNRKSPEPGPIPVPKRGVALPKQSTQRPPIAIQFAFPDDEDSDEEVVRKPIEPPKSPPPVPSFAIYEDDDDGASVIEEDSIDRMISGGKRKSGSFGASRGSKRQKNSPLWDHTPKPRQPRITEVLGRSKSVSAAGPSKQSSSKQQRKNKEFSKHNTRKRAATPPRLGILDVMEPMAPKFIRLAARAAKGKANLGRTSPDRKMIILATRADNIDALSSLRDWKSGKIRQKATAPTPHQRQEPRSRPVLERISSNPQSPSPQPGYISTQRQPKKLVRQSRLDGAVWVDRDKQTRSLSCPSAPKQPKRKPQQSRASAFYPAQLETDEVRLDRSHLRAHKRSVDAFYQSQRIAPLISGLDRSPSALLSAVEIQSRRRPMNEGATINEPSPQATRLPAKSRPRKARAPRHLDIEAPRFAHANDPLPAVISFVEEAVEESQPQLRDKLSGLGEFGTHYTHHFEIFPLDQGVYFHASTIIGRGYVRKALESSLADKVRQTRAAVSFVFDKQSLRWGVWDDNTSSELGILVDWIAEQLGSEVTAKDAGGSAIDAADFILRYILDSYHVWNEEAATAFLSRIFEVFSSIMVRLETLNWTNSPESLKKIQLEVSTRFTLATVALRTLSGRQDPMLGLKFENILKKFAAVTIKGLLSCGLEDVRALYGNLQQPTFRERGVRSEQWIVNCWVVLIRIFESANIRRSSFWDVAQSVMITPTISSSTDAQFFESHWRDLFTLLPLGEVDNDGVLVPGLRKNIPLEGWSLPQRLIKRVFELYKSKVRQGSNFNEYCRALVARCHFLVEQWGWYRCTGIIGTIFDFFGTEDLANLRNEEVYQSPRFLEQLSKGPCLSLESTDRCFHIFIKVLALTIQRLKQLGRHNDIKNLVARTLPNHNRQHLKEDMIHQRDLAALRNHHDLLCTIFWAAPPDLRPALNLIHLIEKLVVPASAHKEAVLINIRAWGQLARFVVSGGEDVATFREFVVWSNNVFNQVLDQYLSAASDIEQQFRALSTEVRGISTEVRDEMIAKNKATALDLLHFLAKSSLDVLKHAEKFEAMVAAFNVSQLQKVFTSLDFQAPGSDWGLLKVALETVEYFFGRVDEVSEEQYSVELEGEVDRQQIDDAWLLFNEKLAKDFFWMARTIMALPGSTPRRALTPQTLCVEKAVALAGRIASRFFKDAQLSPYFTPGKHALFLHHPSSLSPSESPYFPLFLATLLENYIFDYTDLHTSSLGLWILCLVKPSRLLKYENHLGSILQKHKFGFIFSTSISETREPDYTSNLTFFASAIRYMRRELLKSTDAKHLRADYAHNLQAVMNRMKTDLALLRADKVQHTAHIDFCRNVIDVIKSYGVNICAIDPFFTQPGPDYSPPLQDPMLHTAGIVAYGVRLGEKDAKAVPQLFHYLFNNFKIALGNGRLEKEREILGNAVRSEAEVAIFVLGWMIPAVVKACAETSAAWLLLEVYVDALRDVIGEVDVPREFGGEVCRGLLEAVLAWFGGLKGRVVGERELCIMGLLMKAVEVVKPSLRPLLYDEDEGVHKVVQRMAAFLEGVKEHSGSDVRAEMLPPLEQTGRALDMKVSEFARVIVNDVKRNWVVTRDKVTIQMATARTGTQTSTQSGQGTSYALEKAKMLEKWWDSVKKWDLKVTIPRKERGRRKGRGAVVDDFMVL